MYRIPVIAIATFGGSAQTIWELSATALATQEELNVMGLRPWFVARGHSFNPTWPVSKSCLAVPFWLQLLDYAVLQARDQIDLKFAIAWSSQPGMT